MNLNLIVEKVKPIYHCLEIELYPLGAHLANYCKDNILDFNNFSGKFTTTYCDFVKNLFITAEALPDAVIRSSDHEKKRLLIIPQAAICLDLAIRLKLHIENAFTQNLWKATYKEAGFDTYKKAVNGNWEVILKMLNDMKTFITNNSATLIAGGMPSDFGTNFNTQLQALRPLVATFISAENEAILRRNAKITANNLAYTELKIIAKTGKVIYKNNQSKRLLFTITKQLELISGAGSHWRKFVIEADNYKTVERVVRNSYFKNTGFVPIMICEGISKCTTGITVQPEETIKLAFEGNIITVNNLSADKKAKFICRCMKV